MIKKNKLTIISSLLLSLIITSCNTNNSSNDTSISSLVDIYVVSSSEKIRKEDIEYSLNGKKSLNFDAVIGETESLQLMLTAKKQINSFDLVSADLIDENKNILKASDFEIYVEKYLDISLLSNSSALYPSGSYPDALVPMDLSKKANENNILARNNQGIWITLKVNNKAKTGNYSGKFKLMVNDLKEDIDVNVKIRNVSMPQKATAGTIFLNRKANVLIGEHDGTDQIMQRYFEQMLDYRITLGEVPIYNGNEIDYANYIEKNFDNPNLTTYMLPFKVVTKYSNEIGNYPTIDIDFFKKHVKELAIRSTSTKDLVKNAMLYIYSVTDEPEMNGGEYIVREIEKDFIKAKKEIVNELLRTDPDFFNKRGDLKTSILKLRNIITGSCDSEVMQGYVDTYCPMINLFQTEEERNKINDICNKYDAEIWWYTCISPRNPYATYHIDDNLLGARLLSWMQADYGIVGNLYYDVSSYGLYSDYDGNTNIPCNQYDQPYRWDNAQAVNGDGFLVYPGSKYNYYGFIPSIRLMAIRDGLEEFELLKKFENDCEEIATYYDTNIDAKAILNEMYDKLFTGTIPTVDTELFNQTRTELLNNLEEINNETKFFIKSININGNKAKIEMLLSDEYLLEVNQSLLNPISKSGKGSLYCLNMDLSKNNNYLYANILNKKDKQLVSSISKYICGQVVIVDDFEKVDNGIIVSNNSHYYLNSDSAKSIDGNSLHAIIKSSISDDEAYNQNFKPSITFKKERWNSKIDFKNVDTIEFDILSENEDAFNALLSLKANNQTKQVGSFIVSGKGKFKHIKIDMSSFNWSKLDSVDAIVITLPNSGTIEKPTIYDFYIDNMYVTYTREE